MRKPAAMNSGLFLFPLSLRERARVRVGLCSSGLMAAIVVESPAAMPEKLIAASAPQAGYFSLLVQRKVTKRKHTPEPPTFPLRVPLRGKAQGAHPCAPVRAATGSAHPCASRLVRARAELAERKKPRPAQTAARDTSRPRLRCSAAATGPKVKKTGNCRLG